LTVFIHLHNGNIVDASLTPTTRQFFEKISSGSAVGHSNDGNESALAGISRFKATDKTTDKTTDNTTDSTADNTADKGTDNSTDTTTNAAPPTEANGQVEDTYERIELPLVFDSVFFDMLLSDVSNLDALQDTEQDHLQEEVKELGKQVSQVSRPTRFSKSDMDRWRRIFELYLDAEIFFATHEREHGARSSQKALKQLQWFQGEVNKQQLVSSFKLPESRTAFICSFKNLTY
jgi:E3 ubiquitin-protein ligase BAH